MPQSGDAASQQYLAARDELLARSGAPSRARRTALCALTDAWLQALYVASGASGISASLVAVGGYGRGDLAPGSDLDLVLLVPAQADPADVTAVADRLWYPIWDSKAKLGHAVRTVKEALKLASEDLDTATSFLQVRRIADGANSHIDLGARLCEGRQRRGHHHRGDVLGLHRRRVHGDAHPVQHVRQALRGEHRLPLVAGPIQPNDKPVADQLILTHAFYVGDVLDPHLGRARANSPEKQPKPQYPDEIPTHFRSELTFR